MKALTPRQHMVLDAIAEFHARHGYSPTLAEIAEAAHLGGPSSATHHVRRLKAMGLVRYERNCARSIRLAPGPDVETVPVSACEVCGQDMPADHANHVQPEVTHNPPGDLPDTPDPLKGKIHA
ncbi:MarR family transcriptional regulator [Sphaerisporangium sp. TRM90804]|uniref:LexA family protein n=1 Tax=Sphaerisporangium sp. TRM90804 TaxID=3031113 RepID=UPI00244CDA4F|nr:MarR family transcriptional regulator [Sphaerisporangium sp. TRM90804]MDH2424842.1 MarR family transcriptional regulator [Sphaerisporangium sp. TRM90804]